MKWLLHKLAIIPFFLLVIAASIFFALFGKWIDKMERYDEDF